nr:phosphoglycolate phosphatase 2 [Ipomoea batatas]
MKQSFRSAPECLSSHNVKELLRFRHAFSLIATGKKLVFVPNNSTKSRKQYARRFSVTWNSCFRFVCPDNWDGYSHHRLLLQDVFERVRNFSHWTRKVKLLCAGMVSSDKSSMAECAANSKSVRELKLAKLELRLFECVPSELRLSWMLGPA